LIYSITQTLTIVISLSALTSGIIHLQGEGCALRYFHALSPWFINHQILPSELSMPFQIISCAKWSYWAKRIPYKWVQTGYQENHCCFLFSYWDGSV